jgi:hypothetical protein
MSDVALLPAARSADAVVPCRSGSESKPWIVEADDWRPAARLVGRAVVRPDDEVDAVPQMELDVLADDVDLIAHEERHHQSHAMSPRLAL